MNYVILDTGILIRFPEVFSLKNPEYKLVLLRSVFDEFKETQKYIGDSVINEILETISNASKSNICEFVENSYEQLEEYLKEKNKDINTANIDRKYLVILYWASQYKKQENTYISTLDTVLIKNAERIKIENITLNELKKIVEKSEGFNAVFFNSSTQNLILNIIIGLFLSALIFLSGVYKDDIIEKLNIWFSILIIFFAGLCLFIVREKFRLGYGIVEFIIGFISIIWALPDDMNYEGLHIDFTLGYKVLTGLYIMVRGLDNIVKGLKGRVAGIWLEERWGIKGG